MESEGWFFVITLVKGAKYVGLTHAQKTYIAQQIIKNYAFDSYESCEIDYCVYPRQLLELKVDKTTYKLWLSYESIKKFLSKIGVKIMRF